MERGTQMIKLIVDGACKGCPWQDIRLMGTTARCIHDYLCKYVDRGGMDWDEMQNPQTNAENKDE